MIGVYGGTFDPIHYGHLRPVGEVAASLALPETRFIPAAVPPHRSAPGASAAHRLRMVELALADLPGFRADDRELRRGGPSYTIDTLASLRAEFASAPLGLILGSDAFLGLPTWRRWRDILALAHLIVMTRPGYDQAEVPAWARPHLVADRTALGAGVAGGILVQVVSPVPVSASEIRRRLAHGEPVEGMLPPAVLDYIRVNRLYQKEHDAA